MQLPRDVPHGHGRNDYGYSNSTYDALLTDRHRACAPAEAAMFEAERMQ
jgi:hypothetical protein